MAITMTENHPRIRDFLNAHGVGILATASAEGIPHAATIYFIIDDDFNIYFITKEQTTKHNNLAANPHAALAVYDAKSQSTIQVTGSANEVHDIKQVEYIFGRVLEITHQTSGKNHKPPVSKINGGKYVAYRIKPKTLRMAEFVKAEYPPSDPLFEVVTFPEKESLDG
jgi:general stress protein 26